jgi:uncharacterized caspase-like protein
MAAIAIAAMEDRAAAEEKRIALVIGNSAYKNTAVLPNPRNDATDMAAQLKGLGFNVILGLDLDKVGMDRNIGEFVEALAGAEIGVLFYGGHGLQVGGTNYLVPVDAGLTTAAALDFEMVRLDLVQRAMEREAPINIVFLDACRDNPLARTLARALGTRAAGVPRGLAPVQSGIGTLISFSTQPGNVALDGEGRNSPFAAALIKHLADNDSVNDILINVRNEVMAATGNRQIPWEPSALRTQVYLRSAATAPAGAAAPAPPPAPSYEEQAELALWSAVKDSDSPELLRSFLKQFPHGRYAELARLSIRVAEQAKELATLAARGREEAEATVVQAAALLSETRAEVRLDSGSSDRKSARAPRRRDPLRLTIAGATRAKGRDCARFNGPYGYYESPWCK